MFAAPAASAEPVGELVDGVADTVNETLAEVNGLLDPNADDRGDEPKPAPAPPAAAPAAEAEPTPNAGAPPNYVPPAHGTNQHGQGTGAVVDLTPSDSLPLPYEPGGGSEDVVVGGSRGEIVGGQYHGHVTILSLLGNELIQGADTGEGQSSDGPLGDVNALLGDVCTASGLCLSALAVASDTVDGNSSNSFSVASANLNPGGALPLLNLGAVQSTGTISQTGDCRTATGTSQVAGANVANVIGANVIDSSSSSGACRDGSTTQTNTSSVIGLQGAGLPLPAPGCENGTPNSNLTIPVVAGLVCNADNSSGSGGTQLTAPFGVREGLTAVLLGTLVKTTTAASESQANAPGGVGGGGGDDGGNNGGGNNNGGNNNDNADDDRDGDGIPNQDDACPNIPGPPSNDGCPIDTDGDGIPDDEDACPTIPGPASNDGCPTGIDTDGDGIPDDADACPTIPGPASNDGCPFGGGPTGDGPDNLAFTGSNVLTLALIGLGVGGSGLGLMALADRRRRRVSASV